MGADQTINYGPLQGLNQTRSSSSPFKQGKCEPRRWNTLKYARTKRRDGNGKKNGKNFTPATNNPLPLPIRNLVMFHSKVPQLLCHFMLQSVPHMQRTGNAEGIRWLTSIQWSQVALFVRKGPGAVRPNIFERWRLIVDVDEANQHLAKRFWGCWWMTRSGN